ncbi:hypothetical protein MTR_7g033240 [Medicago truncatula]|uniref:Uncharacterized protein n=1 Tax=Medicago truncatula TaxID=3880 RepID=A0A072TY35_MEDTR|nr:hypothetical protein MTR_7g033240 [Medicago truncatula]
MLFFHPWPFKERGLFEILKISRGFFELETRVEAKQQECKGEAARIKPHFENCCCHEAVP